MSYGLWAVALSLCELAHRHLVEARRAAAAVRASLPADGVCQGVISGDPSCFLWCIESVNRDSRFEMIVYAFDESSLGLRLAYMIGHHCAP